MMQKVIFHQQYSPILTYWYNFTLLFQRWNLNLKPSRSWGPAGEEDRINWKNYKVQCNHR